jgi:hypothetical protein
MIMALYMDVHNLGPGVALADVEKAHQADLQAQGSHGVDYQRYWVNEKEGKIFCLVEAPSIEAAQAVHREAHGLVTDDVFLVAEGR